MQFYKFAHINNTIRLREGAVYVRLSDLLEGAPEGVLYSIAHILFAKLYRKPIEPLLNLRYRRFITRVEMREKAMLIRQLRGRKTIITARGDVYDLDEVFDSLNRRFFFGLMGKPQLTWSRHYGRRLLGHYDAAHNTIMISKAFDRAQVPRYAIEYLMYHEMLHLKHPVKTRGGRRCVHSRAFGAEERLFPELAKAVAFLKRL
ncbi:MAG: SprT-like domain-containing protein [Acidobacteriaceae bacterium]